MSEEVDYPGHVKLDFCRKLGADWADLADLLEIPSHVARGFVQGNEARKIWEWLLTRGALGELPKALRRIDREDLADAFDGQARTVPAAVNHSNVPSLPSHYLEREELLSTLRKRLLAPPADIGSGAPLVMITGMAGVGKSVTARALARDPSVIARFTDGIVWLDLGKKPDIQTRQNQLIEALGGVVTTSVDQQQANVRLNDLLRGKSCLLVLDDAWDPEHLRAFEVHHPTVTILVTTRDRELLHTENTEELVDALDEQSALRLFARHLEIAPEELNEDELGIVQECAGLPLALAVAGAVVAGRRWYAEGLLHKLRFGRVDQFDIRLRDYPYPSLLKALDASVVELSTAQINCYLSLAVFKDVGSVPRAAFGHLWASQGLSQYEVQDMLVALDRRSLLSLDSDHDRVTLHGLLYDYIALRVDPAVLLGHHKELAHSYLDHWGGLQGALKELRTDNELDEGQRYGISRVVFHLAEGGCTQEMHGLLALSVTRASGKDSTNLWYSVRNALHQGQGYLEDIRIAWDSVTSRSTEPSTHAGSAGREASVTLQLRYALVTASIGSIAAQLSARLLSRMADTGAWPGDRCLHHALRIPQAEARTEALTKILPHLAASDAAGVVTEVVAGLPHVKKNHLADVLAEVADRLSPRQATDVLDMVAGMASSMQFANAVEALLPALTETLARRALELTAGFKNNPHRARARALLATALPPAECVDLQIQCLFENSQGGAAHHRAVTERLITDSLGDATDEERVLGALGRASADANRVRRIELACVALPFLSGGRYQAVLEQARSLADDIPNPLIRSLSLSRLAGAVGADDCAVLADAALAAVASVDGHGTDLRTEALVAAAIAGADSAALDEALEASIAAAKRSQGPPRAFLQLCPYLPDELLDRAIKAAGSMGLWRGKAFRALAPRLSADHLPAFLQLARRNTWSAKQLLPVVFEFLTPQLRAEAVAVTAGLDAAADRAEILQAVASYMDPDTAELALPSALALEDRTLRFATLSALAAKTRPAVRHTVMEDTVTEFLEAGTAPAQVRWIGMLSENLDRGQLQRMSSRMEALCDMHLAVSAITAFVPFGDPEQRHALVQAATGLTREVPDAELQLRALVGLARRMPRKHRGDVLTEALEALGNVMPPTARWEHAFAVLSAAPPVRDPATLRPALSLLPKAEDAELYAQAWSALVSLARRESHLLPEEDGPEPTAHAEQTTPEPTSSVRTYTTMFALSGPPLRKLAFAMAADEEAARAAGLIAVAPHLPPPLQEEAAAGARLLKDNAMRAHALHGIACAMDTERGSALLTEAWDVRLSAVDRSAEVRVAAAFLPLAPRRSLLPAGHCLLQEARAVEGSLARSRAVITLADVLPTALTGLAVGAARRIPDPSLRATAVAALCKRLPVSAARHTAAEVGALIIREHDAPTAARALASLSPFLAEEDRTRLGFRVLETASALGCDVLAAASYRDLARVDAEAVGRVLLEKSKKLGPPDRAAVLAGLAKYCSASERQFALSHLDAIADARVRATAARSLIESAEDTAGFFDVVVGLGGHAYFQSTLLGALASHGSAEVKSRALQTAFGITRLAPRVSAVMTIAPQVCEEAELARIEQEFLSLCTSARNHGERASALVELSRFAQGRERTRIIVEALVESLTLAVDRRRADLARTMGRTLADTRDDEKGDLLENCLHRATVKGRSAIVSCLPVIVPLMLSLEADGVVRESSDAVKDIFRWWM